MPLKVERDEYGRMHRIFLSAKTGEGLAECRLALAECAQEHVFSPNVDAHHTEHIATSTSHR
jgi:GTP-binding protein HflX